MLYSNSIHLLSTAVITTVIFAVGEKCLLYTVAMLISVVTRLTSAFKAPSLILVSKTARI
jgi:hypothetical protein